LVGIDQANRPGESGEAIGYDAFQDLGDSFQKDDDPKGSRRGVVIFAWFGKYNAVGTFQSGGVVSMSEEGAQEGREEERVDFVDCFPYPIGDLVGAWSGCVGRFAERPCNFLGV